MQVTAKTVPKQAHKWWVAGFHRNQSWRPPKVQRSIHWPRQHTRAQEHGALALSNVR